MKHVFPRNRAIYSFFFFLIKSFILLFDQALLNMQMLTKASTDHFLREIASFDDCLSNSLSRKVTE